MNEFGKKIKQIRIKNGLTQEEFANSLGYKSKSTINKIEQGINVISYDKLMDLLNKYNEDLDYIFGEDSKLHINPKSSKSRLFISFSSRDEGNSFEIIKKYLNENDDYILFKNINYHSCSKCNYECMKNECKYRFDDIYKLYDLMCKYKKIYLIIPMYGGNPSSLYFIFNERSQDYFMHNDNYEEIISKLFYIGIYGSKDEYPYFLNHFESIFSSVNSKKHVLGIERHKYNLKLNDSIMDVEEIIDKLNQFIQGD